MSRQLWWWAVLGRPGSKQGGRVGPLQACHSRKVRIRAAAVVVEDGDLLVIARHKDGRDYRVLPGGGVEAGESFQEACRRELFEETGLDGDIVGLLPVPVDVDAPVAYFSVRVDSRALSLGSPERERNSADNRYEPTWVPISSLDEVPLLPESARLAVEITLATDCPDARA